MFFNVPIVFATPTGSQVVAGSAGVGQAGNTTTVTMSSGRAVINWNSLNTSSNEILQFIKDSGGFAVLNRVIQGGATQFDGSLFGNQGHIIVVNPNGIVFGPTALVQAHKFTASGLDISNPDFMNGHYQFVGGDGTGMVSNYGEISAEQVALIGKQVLNAGVIRSPGGYVLMAAGDRVLLGQDGSNVVVEVDAVAVSDPTDPTSTDMGDVINEGTIEAAGGKIVLAAGDTFSRAIEGLDGLSVAVESGTGRVGQFGTLNADGVEGDGGSITLTAGDVVALGSDSVTTANAGTNGDGGDIITYSPDMALFHEGASVEAKGGSESGDGGFFELSGKEYVDVLGVVDMTAQNGQSGNFLIDPRNITIDNSGNNEGSSGDPWRTWRPNADDATLDVDKLEGFLGKSNVKVTTAGGGVTQSGWIKLDAGKDLDYGGEHNLTLKANDYISIYSGIDFTGSGDVTLKADNRINVYATHVHKPGGNFKNTYGIYLNGGTLTMNSGRDGGGEKIRLFDDIKAGNIVLRDNVMLKGDGKNQRLVATSLLTAEGNITKNTSGNLRIEGNSGIELAGNVQTSDGDLKFVGDITANGTGSQSNQLFNADAANKQLIVNGTITKNTSGNLTLQGGRDPDGPDTTTDIILHDDVSVEQGSLTIGLDGDDDDTLVKPNTTLYARDNVTVKDSLTGEGALSLDAGNNLNLNKGVTAVGYLSLVAGNEIDSDGVISVTGSVLEVQQGQSIDTADFLFANQSNTDLTLISDTGSVTSDSGANAANKWKSIGAHADDNITLARSNGKNEITLGDSGTAGKSLIADNGYIDIDGFNVENSADFADWDLEAETTLSVSVVHGIDLGGDLTSGGDMELLADTDTRYGHDVVVGGHINSGGTLDIEGTNVDIQSAHSDSDMDIYAHGLYGVDNAPDEPLVGSGDVHVGGTLDTTDGHIIIEATEFAGANPALGPAFGSEPQVPYVATGTIYLEDNVTANGGFDDDVLLMSNTVASDNVKIESTGDDVVLAEGKTLHGFGNLTIEADDTIALGVNPDDKDKKWKNGYGGEVTADGKLLMTAGDDVYGHGKLMTTDEGNGDLFVYADDDIHLYETDISAYAAGELKLIADSDGTHNGNLTVYGDLYGNMTLSGYDVTEYGNITSFGTLDVDADDDITLKKNVSSVGAMTMNAGDNIRLNEDGGDTSSGGTMTLNAGLDHPGFDLDYMSGSIKIEGDADSGGSMTMTAIGNDEIIASDDVMNGSIKIDGHAKSKYDMEMTATGGNKSFILFDLATDVMNGSISIGDYAKSRYGNMTMTADGGDVLGTVSLFGPDVVFMNGSIYIGDYAESKYNMLMTATGGSEGIDLYDVLDFDGMNGSIFIENNAKSSWGSLTMTAEGGSESLTYDETDIDLMNGSIKIGGDATSKRDMLLTAKGGHELLTEDELDVDGMNGSILIGGDARSWFGGVTMTAEGGSEILTEDCLNITGMSGSIKIGGDVTSLSHLDLSAKGGSEIGTVDKYDIDGMNGSIWIEGDAISLGSVTMTAEGGSEILTYDEWDVDGMNGSIKIGSDVRSLFGSVTMTAKGGSELLTADLVDIDGMNGSIKIGGDVTSMSNMNLSAKGGSEIGTVDKYDIDGMNGSIWIEGDAISLGSVTMTAEGGSELLAADCVDIDGMNGSIKIGGDAESWFGGVTMTAEGGKEILSADLVDFDLMNGSIKIGGHVKSKYDLELTAKGGCEFLTIDGLDFDVMNGSICIGDYVRSKNGAVTLTAEGTDEILTFDGLDIDLMNGSIFVGGSVESQDDTIISAQGGQKIWSGDYYDFSLLSGDVVVLGDIQSYGGNVEIYSSDDTTYLGGDVTAFDNVLLNNNTRFIGHGDQRVTAETGMITANGWLDKDFWGSLYLNAYDDISLWDYVRTGPYWWSGGVSIISDNGKIFTPDEFGGETDTLNVAITGRSSYWMCRETMWTTGVDLPKNYYVEAENTGKAAIVIMSEADLKLGSGAELTAYGNYDPAVFDDRPGVDFLDHIEGYKNPGWPIDVAIYLASNTGNVDVGSPVNPIPTGGVMVVDAYHTVSPFGTDFLSSVIAGNVSWLEVCSRITPTLNHAIIYGTLPYASNPGAYPGAGMYVLRGENLDVGTGAWVLASNKDAPLAERASAEAGEEEFAEGGCPALMEWLANEIGIPAENIQVAMADAFALNTDIQPCEMCARLKDASTILEDSEGTHIPAMAQVVNEFVAPDAPIAPEQMASIASAMASPEAGTQYAAAGQWLDALAEYVGILNTEMGFAAVESVAFAGKYVTPITEGDNASLVAYVEARLAALGG